MMEVGYYGSLVLLNIALLLKYHYYKSSEAIMVDLLEEIITILIYFMLLVLGVKLIYESFPWKWLKNLVLEELKDKSVDSLEEENEDPSLNVEEIDEETLMQYIDSSLFNGEKKGKT